MINTITPWILAIRPRTLPAAVGPLLVGNMLALHHDSFSWSIAFTSMICAIFLQISANLANDYFDHKNGIDTSERLGPIRVTQSGLLAANHVAYAIIFCLSLTLFIGSYLIWHGGWPIAVLAIISLFGALGYSGGPYPLASHGLGEVAAFIFFGLVAVVGSYALQTGHTDTPAWLLGCAIGLLNAAILLVNNIRDIPTDSSAGKLTLAVHTGEAFAKVLYHNLVYLPIGIVITGFLLGLLPGLPVLLSSLCFVLSRKLSSDCYAASGQAFNRLLGRSAGLTLLFSLLFCLGLAFTPAPTH